MWRRNELSFRNNAQEDQGSDQSISEEDEGLESEWKGNTISLGGALDNKGGMQVLSQLDLLRDSYELHSTEKESIASHERNVGFFVDDEVENPHFNDKDGSARYPRHASATHSKRTIYLPTMASISQSDEEIISDDEKANPPTDKITRDNAGGTWSEASREVEALVLLNENSGCSSSHGVFMNETRSCKGGGRMKAKPKFLFRSYSHKKDPSLVVSGGNGRTSSDNILLPDEIGAAADGDMDKCMAESQLVLHENESEQPENHIVPSELARKHDSREHSMAEFLDCFQGRNGVLQGRSELEIEKRGKREQMGLKRNTSALGDRNLDDEDLPEDYESEPPSPSDHEENPQSLKLIIPRRTMADHFHEAFGTVSVIDERPNLALPRPLCNRIYGKLQQVMQSEKERDMDYLKNLSAETSFKDENLSMSVRILSRSLEAKLIVCSCTSVGDGKNSDSGSNLQMEMKDAARTLTIIFNPRICNDAELEVGNLIHVHQPWKEVPVKGKDEVVFLCSYFSQVQS
ncbi:hypothetical protein BUALT_Bualt02G0231300 [Buddleja alternifolia]|uniref:Uncharacterized protein n=1 Tax=Buddleja alternifolia TaxID=168488 RepID=A0AAV6Y2M7_9LAMI|nr:hypothetical protein BUALT_Bualt02G0231300 [Buddleja alternifolia]